MTSLAGKTFFLDQHGCAKNQVDGEVIIARLTHLGLVMVGEADQADLIIVNSCGFIESAKRESLDAVLDARRFYPNAKVLLAGCLAERYAKTLADELDEADAILGNGDLSLVDQAAAQLLTSLGGGDQRVFKGEQRGIGCGERGRLLSHKGSAYVKVTEGCDNRCSFCAIPLIRGALRSRTTDDIVKEVRQLLARGVFEINLAAQDLAAYGCGVEDAEFASDGWHKALYGGLATPAHEDAAFAQRGKTPLCMLLEKILRLEGDFWLRLLYLHPDHITQDVIEAVRGDKRILPYFDIPFQSGDGGVIRAMGRKGSFASYVALVKKIRAALPTSCIRTTFLAGFPGETDEAAANTQAFLKTIRCDWAGGFAYSKEEDTPAQRLAQQVPHKKAKSRLSRLLSAQQVITAQCLKGRLDQVYDVLIEEVIPPEGGAAMLRGADTGTRGTAQQGSTRKGAPTGLAIGRAWFDAPEVDGSFVVRYDASDAAQAARVREGAVVKAVAVSAAGVDIQGDLVV